MCMSSLPAQGEGSRVTKKSGWSNPRPLIVRLQTWHHACLSGHKGGMNREKSSVLGTWDGDDLAEWLSQRVTAVWVGVVLCFVLFCPVPGGIDPDSGLALQGWHHFCTKYTFSQLTITVWWHLTWLVIGLTFGGLEQEIWKSLMKLFNERRKTHTDKSSRLLLLVFFLTNWRHKYVEITSFITTLLYPLDNNRNKTAFSGVVEDFVLYSKG